MCKNSYKVKFNHQTKSASLHSVQYKLINTG